MSDETILPESQPADQPATQPDPAAELAALKAEYAAERARTQAELESHKQTLAAVQGQLGMQQQPVQIGNLQLPPQAMQFLQQRGLKPEEIQNALPLVMPILELYGAPVLNQLEQAKLDNAYLKAERNKKEFPKWDVLADTIEQVRQQAAQQGRLLTPKDAYQWAMGVGYDKLKEAEQAEQAATARARDASTQGAFTASPRLQLDTADKVIKSADDIVNMSDDDAARFIDKFGNAAF